MSLLKFDNRAMHSTQVQKLAHRSNVDRRSYLTIPSWWMGLLLMAVLQCPPFRFFRPPPIPPRYLFSHFSLDISPTLPHSAGFGTLPKLLPTLSPPLRQSLLQSGPSRHLTFTHSLAYAFTLTQLLVSDSTLVVTRFLYTVGAVGSFSL